MTQAIWQSKRVLKTGKHYQIPKNIKNRPKGVSLEEWQLEVAEWKMNKLIILDKVPKTSKKTFVKSETE